MPVQIVYPFKDTVSDEQIRTWYSDAVANGEADEGYDTVDAMARELDDAGILTLKGSPDEDDYYEDDYEDDYGGLDYDDDRIMFADPGGRSALRAATKDNPRNLPCPNCGEPNRLTPEDRRLGYQCDRCADAAEMGIDR